MDGVVKGGLSVQKLALGKPWAIGNIGLKVDVRRKDITRARGAKFGCIKVGCEENEWEIGIVVGGHVGENAGAICTAFEGPRFVGVKECEELREREGG